MCYFYLCIETHATVPEMYETVRTVSTYCGTYKKYLVAYFFMRIGR